MLALHTNNIALYHSSEWVHNTGNHGSDFKAIVLLYVLYVLRVIKIQHVHVVFSYQRHCVKMVLAMSEQSSMARLYLNFHLRPLPSKTGVHFPSCFQWKQ